MRFPHERTVAKLHRNFLRAPKQYVPLTTMGEKGRELPHVTQIETKQQTVLKSFSIKSLGEKVTKHLHNNKICFTKPSSLKHTGF